jgi:predicted transcriptional regulator
MEAALLGFEKNDLNDGIESKRVGEDIVISYRGWFVMGFDRRDSVARDLTIASLLKAGIKGKTVARLCEVSQALVSRVKKTIRRGGSQAISHGRPGRTRKLTGAKLRRAQKLRRRGLTVRQIGEMLGVSPSCASRALRGMKRGGRTVQLPLEAVGEGGQEAAGQAEAGGKVEEAGRASGSESVAAQETTVEPEAAAKGARAQGPDSPSAQEEGEELMPGEPLPAGPAEHRCRYAGTLLICAAVQALGLWRALVEANVRRPRQAVYDAGQAVVALLAAWASGLGSLEAMHERDARALGVVLGLERSPSVRTMHRAIAQMVVRFDPVALGTWLLRGLAAAVGQLPRVFGLDGHFKAYYGPEPIDKGYDSKRRIAQRGVADVLVHDERGRVWLGAQVGAGDHLHEWLLPLARQLREELGGQPVVLGFDRGGFCFETLGALDAEGFGYVAWVPANAGKPELASLAPVQDGVGEQPWRHPRFGEHHDARLLVQRDGAALVPVVTNLPPTVSADQALEMLRQVRGAQENDIKAARSFAHLDRLVDRGGARHAPDDRLVSNPARVALMERQHEVRARQEELSRREALSRKDQARLGGDQLIADFELALLRHQLSRVPAKVPRAELEPEARRAWLKTRNRSLLQPLKYLLANARRWLLSGLGSSLAPSDGPWDASATNRTLEALIRAPGTVQFGAAEALVTLDLQLPPQPHERLSQGLTALNGKGLRFSDGQRAVTFRLAPRPTRQTLPSASPFFGQPENSE